MITAFIISIFGLPKRLWLFLVKVYQKIKATLIYLFIPDKKKKNKKNTTNRSVKR